MERSAIRGMLPSKELRPVGALRNPLANEDSIRNREIWIRFQCSNIIQSSPGQTIMSKVKSQDVPLQSVLIRKITGKLPVS
jgi:hypothetical protein